MRWLSLGAVVTLVGCRDAGQETLANVKQQYLTLLQRGTPAQSRDFDPLLRELATIPEGSRARAGADQLQQAIEAARRASVPVPLAVVPGATAMAAELKGALSQCEALAQQLGPLQGEERQHKHRALDACRRRVDALRHALEHSPSTDAGAAP